MLRRFRRFVAFRAEALDLESLSITLLSFFNGGNHEKSNY